MKNRNENQVRFPGSKELYAYEREARRLRAIEMGRLSKIAAVAIRSFFARSFVAAKAKEMKHA